MQLNLEPSNPISDLLVAGPSHTTALHSTLVQYQNTQTRTFVLKPLTTVEQLPIRSSKSPGHRNSSSRACISVCASHWQTGGVEILNELHRVLLPQCCAAPGLCGCSGCGGPPFGSPLPCGRRPPVHLPPTASTVHIFCECPRLSCSAETSTYVMR